MPIIKAEIQALVADGVKYIQIDAPRYSYYIDPKWREHIQQEMGVDPEQALDEAIRADNACLEGSRKAGRHRWPFTCAAGTTAASGTRRAATTRSRKSCSTSWTSTCFSSSTSPSAPARSRRCGSCRRTKAWCWASSAASCRSSSPEEQLTRRIEEASRYVPLENLAVSPQCGFASAMEGNLLTEDDQWRKLRLVVDTARQVWKDA